MPSLNYFHYARHAGLGMVRLSVMEFMLISALMNSR